MSRQYTPATCEWVDGGKCRRPALRDKSYCEIHYPKVYRTSTVDEIDELAEEDLQFIEALRSPNNKDVI